MRFHLLILSTFVCAMLICGVASAVDGDPTEEPTLTESPTEEPTEYPTIPITTPTTSPIGSEHGYFSISSSPSGGDVYFDGSYQGETPVSVRVASTGSPRHTISVNMAGYESWSTTYNGNPMDGATIPITAYLVPDQLGDIHVMSSPSGATATLDGHEQQTTPCTFSDVTSGRHDVSIYMAGYQTYSSSVYVHDGKTSEVAATLSPLARTGTLSISSNPGKAAVTVDGSYYGTTPTVAGNLPVGDHWIVVTKSGYQDYRAYVRVEAGRTTTVNPTLASDREPDYGTISVLSNPAGADVYIDGVYYGHTRAGDPLVVTEVTPKTYTVLISKAGYQDYTTTMVVRTGENHDLSVTLPPNPNPTSGGIAVISSPTGAEVFEDNVFKGISPLTLDSQKPGSYGISLRMDGYQDWQTTVQVTAGQTSQITATMNAAPTTTTPPTPAPTQAGMIPLTVMTAIGAVAIVLLRRG